MDHEKYQISIERDGRMVPVGSISGETYRTAKRFAAGRYHYICNHFREALRDAASELSEAGFSRAKEMEDRILREGGYARL